MLRNCSRRIIPRVCHMDTSIFTIFNIYVIIAGGKLTDHLHLLCILHCGFIHRTFVCHNDICVRDPFRHQLIRCAIVKIHLAKLLYRFDGDILTDTASVQYYNLHVFLSFLRLVPSTAWVLFHPAYSRRLLFSYKSSKKRTALQARNSCKSSVNSDSAALGSCILRTAAVCPTLSTSLRTSRSCSSR